MVHVASQVNGRDTRLTHRGSRCAESQTAETKVRTRAEGSTRSDVPLEFRATLEVKWGKLLLGANDIVLELCHPLDRRMSATSF